MKKRRIINTIEAPARLVAVCHDKAGREYRQRVALLALVEDHDGQWIMAMLPGEFGCLCFAEEVDDGAYLDWDEAGEVSPCSKSCAPR